MQPSTIRVLVVDDFAPWQSFIERYLSAYSNVRVIGFAADALEAVRKAEELLPDLVLLDVGLRETSGIEAARQIRERAPASAILFLSNSSDPDIVSAALTAGGGGYVLKTAATKELLAGTEAVLMGKPFLSRGLSYPIQCSL